MQNELTSRKIRKLDKILITGIIIGLLLCIAICLSVCIKEKHVYIASLLPVAALVIFVVSRVNRNNITRLSLVIINISMLLRYGLYPAVLMLSGTSGLTYANDVKTTLILIYELIGIYAVIALKGKSLSIIDVSNERAYSSYLGIVTLALILFMVPAGILSPSLLKQFSISSSTVKMVDESTAGFVVSFFSMGIWSLMTFVLSSLGTITKNNNRLTRWLGLLLAMGISFFYLLSRVVNGANVRRWGIICTGIVVATILIRTFPNKKKQISTIATVGIIVGLIIGSLVKFNETNGVYAFIQRHGTFLNLDAYFSGIKGVKDGLSAIENNAVAQSFRSTLTDLLSGAPFISRFFNANTDSIPVIYLSYVMRTDLICPLTVQSIAHFGIIGAPVLSMLFTYLALHFNKRLIETENLYETFVYIELTFYLSLVMELNTLIVLGVVWIRLIYLLLLRFDHKVVIRR